MPSPATKVIALDGPLPVNTHGRITARRLVVYTKCAKALQARRLEQNSESWKKQYYPSC